MQGLCELESQAIILSEKDFIEEKEEDICIQINAPGSLDSISKRGSGHTEDNPTPYIMQR